MGWMLTHPLSAAQEVNGFSAMEIRAADRRTLLTAARFMGDAVRRRAAARRDPSAGGTKRASATWRAGTSLPAAVPAPGWARIRSRWRRVAQGTGSPRALQRRLDSDGPGRHRSFNHPLQHEL